MGYHLPSAVALLLAAMLTGCRSEADGKAALRAESVNCGNYMVSIGCAAKLWADEHGERWPSSLVAMSNELTTPLILVCPGDHTRAVATNWAAFTPANSSYEIVNGGMSDGNTNTVFLRCKVHGHLGYTDATVFDGVSRRLKTH